MKRFLSYSLAFLALVGVNSTSLAQNEDSVKAYILEFIEPDVNFSLSYGTGSLSLKYEEQSPLTPPTEEFIEEQKKEYESTKDPMNLYAIGQTYRRMNRRKEAAIWQEKALSEIEAVMGRYPDSIELVESAFLIYLEMGQSDLAVIAAKMVSDHYDNSQSLFAESLSYTYTQEFDKGLATSELGLMNYPGEARWYLLRIIHEFAKKMQVFGFGSEAFSAPENSIDRSFLDEAFLKYPDSTQVELVAALGNFFLFAYEEVLPQFYDDVADFGEIEGFSFDLNSEVNKKLDVHLERIIQLSKRKEFKNWHSIHYTLGVIHLLKSDYKKSIKHCEKAIALMAPKYRQGQDNAYSYYDNLITCHRILGDVEAAEKCVIARATEEVNLDPLPQYQIERAMYRAMDKDFEEAIQLLDKTIALDSSAIDAYTNKALLMMHAGKNDEVTKILDIAQTVNPNDIFLFKSVILYNLLNKSKALADNQINQLEAYDATDGFIEEARNLLKTE
ncbi:MAG: tetratricopeptide repeat protein [Crocinitomicaceae bacterium]